MTGRMRRHLARGLRYGIVFRADGDGDEGKGKGGGGGRPEKPVSEVVASLVSRHGSAETALGVLAGENRDYRKRHRGDQETIQSLRNKLPKEGGVVLTPEQAADYAAYTAMGKPSEVKAKVDKVATLEGELTVAKRKELIREVGAAVGYKPSVLEDRVNADGLHVELKDEQVDDGKGGKVSQKVAYVRKAADANAQLESLTVYAERSWVDYLPSLKAEAAAGNRGGNSGGPAGGVRLPATTTANKDNAVGGLLQKKIAQQQAAANVHNPLLPPKPAATT